MILSIGIVRASHDSCNNAPQRCHIGSILAHHMNPSGDITHFRPDVTD